jgi:succinate dehydrogenase / fumarate reductase cytochrome b subunit
VGAALTSKRVRPTSPHLQIYRWQIGNSLSILHRITGALLGLGLIALSFWWVSLAGGAESYATAANVFGNPLGRLVLIGWTFAFLFHLLNGIRHLFWDAGRGFERTARHASGWAAVIGAAALTLCTWVWIWLHLS